MLQGYFGECRLLYAILKFDKESFQSPQCPQKKREKLHIALGVSEGMDMCLHTMLESLCRPYSKSKEKMTENFIHPLKSI